MKKLLLIIGAICAYGQTVSLSDTLANAVGGGSFTGRITVTLNAPASAQPLYYSTTSLTGWQAVYCLGVTGSDCTTTAAAGTFAATLYANSTITPAGTSYAARFAPSKGSPWSETWVVTPSTTTLRQVRATTVPTPTTTFQPGQIAAGDNGQVLTTVAGVSAWADAAGGALALSSDGPAIDVTNSFTSGAYVVERISNNESGIPNFGSVLAMYAGSNGATVRDNVFSTGYNRGASGKEVTGEHSFYTNIESDYTTSEGVRQVEFYHAYENATGAYSVRPFSITPRIDTNYVEVATRADSIKFGYSDTENDWLRLTSTGTTGAMSLSGDSSITYDATSRYFIFSDGQGLIGYEAGTGYLFKGLTTAALFDLQNTADGALTLNFGGAAVRGIRWNNSPAQFEFQRSTGTWQAMHNPGNYNWDEAYAVAIGPSAIANTGYDLTVWDNRAGQNTQFRIRLGDTQNQSPFEISDNNGSTTLTKFDEAGRLYAYQFRFQGDNSLGLQYDMLPDQPLMFAVGKGIGFSPSSTWADIPDAGISRAAAGYVKITNGYAGALGKIVVSQSTPSVSSDACTAGAIWADTGYVYACTASGTIKRAALSSF